MNNDWFDNGEKSMKKIKILWLVLLLTLPVVVVFLLEPASTISIKNILSCFFGTVFFIDLPIGMCLLHYCCPQLFHQRKRGCYSIVPWVIFTLGCWGIVALDMFLEVQFGEYPENGFSVASAYLFGWLYIWITMLPIGLIYLLIRLFQKFRQ